MADTKNIGHRIGDLWTPSIDNIVLDQEDLIRILERMSPAQYYLLTLHAARNTNSLYKLVAQYAAVNLPDLAEELIAAAAYRHDAAKELIFSVQHLNKQIEARKYKD